MRFFLLRKLTLAVSVNLARIVFLVSIHSLKYLNHDVFFGVFANKISKIFKPNHFSKFVFEWSLPIDNLLIDLENGVKVKYYIYYQILKNNVHEYNVNETSVRVTYIQTMLNFFFNIDHIHIFIFNKKCKIAHYGKPSIPQTTAIFGDNYQSVIKQYKYLGNTVSYLMDL